MSAFTKGDIVRLKSGGPAMVVVSSGFKHRVRREDTEEDFALCGWFDADAHLQSHSIPEFALEREGADDDNAE